MKKTILSLLVITICLDAKNWTIKRNPFTVSDVYIKQTKKSYLEPKNNYIPFKIKLVGIIYTPKTKEAVFDIEFEGVCNIGLNKRKKINTPDIESWLKVMEIGQHYAVVSLNNGEGIRYEVN